MKDMHRIHHTTWARLLIFILFLALPTAGITAEISVEKLAKLGNEAFARGDYDKADTLYSEALEKDPDETALLYNKANVLYKNEKFDEALSFYERAIQKGPAKKLLGSIFFNAGNASLKLAQKEGEGEATLDDLKHRLAFFEKSFDLYRKALETEREVSIAEGRAVEQAGLYTRQNWALAREAWTATWEKIRDLERKNLQLEDGITELMQAKMALLPNLERTYLNSFTDDILNFNLKRLAEYQRDYHEDVLALITIAQAEEEKIQTEIDNLKASQAQQSGTSAQNPQPVVEEDTELQEQLQIATKIKNAVEQAAALDEWIVDGLSRGTPLEAWQNLTKMIGRLQDLENFLKKTDPALSNYFSLLTELNSSDRLLQQALQLKEIEKTSEQDEIAYKKRLELAKNKNLAANEALAKLTFFLTQMQENLRKEPETSTEPDASSATDNQEGEASLEKIVQESYAEAVLLSIDELLKKNQELTELLTTSNKGIEKNAPASLEETIKKANISFTWYKHLQIPVHQSLASLINNLDTLKDYLDDSGNLKDSELQRKEHVRQGPSVEHMETVLFQLDKIQIFLKEKASTSANNDPNSPLQLFIDNLGKQTNSVSTAWKNYDDMRSNEAIPISAEKLSAAADLFRGELLTTLLIFSPDMAIALSFERSRTLHENLTVLLPVNTDNSDAVLQKYRYVNAEAKNLQRLLNLYFNELEKSLSPPNNKEQQEAYSASLNVRKNSPSLIMRFIDQGKAGASLLQEKRFQLTELLFKEMRDSMDKAQLAFQEQPDDGEKALQIALDLQKKLEAQSRFANEALTVNGKSTQVNGFLTASQEDIKKISQIGIEAIEQQVGMTEVPTHGQPPQADPTQQGASQVDPSQLKKAIEKVNEAQEQIKITKSFMTVGEFHNTFEKHPEIQALLQEALDLLKNKDEEKGDDKSEEQQEDGDQEKQEQNGEQNQEGQDGMGESRPQKPLELTASEARELLEQLNKQDEKQQDGKAAIKKSFNTPRPW